MQSVMTVPAMCDTRMRTVVLLQPVAQGLYAKSICVRGARPDRSGLAVPLDREADASTERGRKTKAARPVRFSLADVVAKLSDQRPGERRARQV